ncbi:MAG: anthranilate synthase component I family protein [Candidatus Nitrosocosmicus sp.]|nr:anthranilate synthase component I family protein [Candidatus Nitrosocosmicus sp.]MDN5866070.1 anthranilate synthase component I family protein [Candidatus Nitrosocosmicus sp.]
MSNDLIRLFKLDVEPTFVTLETRMSPFDIFKRLSDEFSDFFIFESLEGPQELVESSIMGFGPKYKIKCNAKTLLVYKDDRILRKFSITDPLDTLKNCFPIIGNKDYRYVGGLVGYFCYEAIKYWEKINVKSRISFPLLEFGYFDDGLVYDHTKKRLEYFFYEKSRIEIIRRLVKSKTKIPRKYDSTFSPPKRSIGKKAFENKVNQIKDHLSNGDIFQTVLSKKIKFTFNGNPLQLYEELRKINPSPYMFYYKIGSRVLLGSSPEMLLRITGDQVETYPIAGSRPVFADKEITERHRRELLKDQKEIAEHTMLVDLARNDLGKVCQFGSVITSELMKVKKFSHIQHIVSHVEGILDQKYDSFDAFRAVFPAGTISGAPKIRAMEIINDLEPESRGPYAGAVGYFSFNQSCDFAITIRSIFFNKEKTFTQSGAGIVIDSVPEKEYQETEDKSHAILSTLKAVEKPAIKASIN